MWFQRHLVDGSDWMDRVATRLPALAIGTPSAQAAERQASRLRPSRPTFWVHNGIEIPGPAPEERLRELRRAYGLDPARPVLGIVGRLQPWKGQHRFLQALALVRERGIDAQGLVVGGTQHGGSPEYPAQLKALAANLALGDAVTFTGQVNDPQTHFALCDVAVSASDEESFGLVLLEAMAHGVPLVAVDHGGPGEILRNGETGILVPDAEPEQLADGIARLLCDPALHDRISQRSAADVRARFTADHMVRELESCFEQLARGIVPASAARQPA
jgi:glycosyltransferase involved in cell wall biosynthesis